MRIDELVGHLDQMSWEEHVDFEIDDEEGGSPSDTGAEEERIQVLARQLSPALLDELEGRPGYVAWTLRLAPHVRGDPAVERARRHLKASDAHVRYFAQRIVELITPEGGHYPEDSNDG